MKKVFSVSILLLTIIQFAHAQTISITGSVKDKQGNPIIGAFLRDSKSNYASFSDSVGNFAFVVNPDAKLIVKGKGYADKVLSIDGQTDFQIVLDPNVDGGTNSDGTKKAASAGEGADRLSSAFAPSSAVNSSSSYSFTEGTSFAARQKEDVHGSRYFFEDFAHGFIISPGDSLFQNNNYLFNYDKISGGLLLTQDQASVIQVNNSQVKSFTIFSHSSKPYVFVIEPDINSDKYVQVITSGKKYNIYKSISTTFVKANYTTNGFTTQGNNYDEYVDDPTYYVLDVQTKQLQKLALKKKAIKAAFAKDADKVSKFMDTDTDDIDDNYLQSLGDALNN